MSKKFKVLLEATDVIELSKLDLDYLNSLPHKSTAVDFILDKISNKTVKSNVRLFDENGKVVKDYFLEGVEDGD